jgi:predicted PurR-regulated permease PerM
MTEERQVLTPRHIFALVFFALLIFLVYQMMRILAPFSSSLIWAGVLTLALSPVHVRVLRLVKGRTGLAAGLMTVGALLAIIIPAIAFLSMLARQSVDLYEWAADLVQSGRLAEQWSTVAAPLLDRLRQVPFLSGLNIKDILIQWLKAFSSGLAAQVGAILKNLFLLIANLVIMLIALFFLFRDGESYYQKVAGVLPFTRKQREAIAKKFVDTFTGVLHGVFFVAFLQGLMTGIGFAVFGVAFPALWGFLAAVLALLPVGGAALVWLPGAAYLFLSGSTIPAVLLAAWGLLLVSLPDNFLKPLLIGRKARIPAFLLFLGILGGLQVYGFLGILFGPLIVTLLAAFVQIYREEFVEK